MKLLFKIIIVVFVLFSACTDSDSIIYPNGDLLNTQGKLQRDTLTAINSTFQKKGKISTGSSSRLLLGAYKDFEGRFLVKFNTIPADSINVDSVYFLIQSIANYGIGVQDFAGKIKLVTQEWNENVNADLDWSYESNVLHTDWITDFDITSDDSVNYSVSIPDTIVSIWQDTTDNIENHGLMLDFENAATIKEFSSRSLTNKPKIVYVYRNAANDSVIRDTVIASLNANLIDYNGTMPDDSLLYVTSGYSHRAFIEFDLSSIPRNAVISYVNFILKTDTMASEISSSRSSSFYFRTVTTPFNQLPSFDVDSTFTFSLFYNISVTQNEDNLIEIRDTQRGETGKYFIQSIINESIDYGSFLVHFVGEGNSISIQAIKGTNGISEANKPKMIIEYFKIPDSRL